MMEMGELVKYYLLPISISGYNFSKTSTTQGIKKKDISKKCEIGACQKGFFMKSSTRFLVIFQPK